MTTTQEEIAMITLESQILAITIKLAAQDQIYIENLTIIQPLGYTKDT